MKIFLKIKVVKEIMNIKYQLRFRKFNETLYEYLDEQKYNASRKYDMDPEELLHYVQALYKAVENVSSVFFLNAKCLERTLVQYRFLKRKFEIPIRLVIGVKKFPFESHTWIMWNKEIEPNTPLTELKENIENYSIIFDSEKDIPQLLLSMEGER